MRWQRRIRALVDCRTENHIERALHLATPEPASLVGRRVLLLAKAFPPVIGGVETYSAAVATEYARRGADVTVITQTPNAAGRHGFPHPDSPVRIVNVGRGPQPLVMLKMFLSLVTYSRQGRPYLVHSTTWRPALTALFFGSRVPTVISVHGREIINGSRLMLVAMRFVLARATGVIAVSNSTLELLNGVISAETRRGRSAVAWNGTTVPAAVSTLAVPPAPGTGLVRMFTLCRLVQRKNILRVVEALGQLQREGLTNFTFHVGGDGPMRDAIEAQVGRDELSERVHLLGRITDDQVYDEYLGCDVFVHPQSHVGDGNDFEGFGLVIADAMACARVVVVGKAGGPSDFVVPNKTGLVVDGDDLDDLAGSLRGLLKGEVDTLSIGSAAQAFAAEQFTWARHVETILGLVTSEDFR